MFTFTGNGPQDDQDITPKAKVLLPRTVSAGAFLKSEFHQRSTDIEAGRYSVRGQRQPVTPVFARDQDIRSRRPVSPPKDRPPKIPERRPSKSKGFFLRAIAGRSEEPRGIKRSDSILSKNTLRRRLSKSKSQVPDIYDASYESSHSSASTRSRFAPASFDIADIGINSRLSSCGTPSSYSTSDTTSFGSSQELFVLSPRINITPEVSSVDNGSRELWVAVEITGVLRRADGRQGLESSLYRSSSGASGMFPPLPGNSSKCSFGC